MKLTLILKFSEKGISFKLLTYVGLAFTANNTSFTIVASPTFFLKVLN